MKIDRSKWEPCEFCGYTEYPDRKHYPKDGYLFYAGFSRQYDVDDFHEEETEDVRFCPQCGRPLNEQAWKELERRINYVNQKLLPKNGVGINEWVEMTERKNNYEEHEH